MEHRANNNELNEEIELLKKELSEKSADNENLKNIINMYDAYEEFARKELLESKELIQAQEEVIKMTSYERKESRDTMNAFKNLQEMSQVELMHSNITLQHILKINKEITSIPKKELLLNHILDSIMPVLKAERGILFLGNESNYHSYLTKNITKEEIKSQQFTVSENVIKESLSTRQSILTRREVKTQHSDKTISIICSPLKNKENIMGMIYLDTISDTSSFKRSDLDTVEIFSAQASIAIENTNLYNNLENEVLDRTKKLRSAYAKINNLYQEIENDLGMAKRIQESLLSSVNHQIGNIAIDIMYLPMAYIGGDIYDIYKLSENYIRIFLADATGHGIQAALVTMLIKGEYEVLKRNLKSPVELLYLLNNRFYKRYQSLNLFFTFVLLDIDLTNNKIFYCSGGHPHQILIQNEKCYSMKNSGRMIGLLKNSNYNANEIPFQKGDKLLLYTDGLFEQFNVKDEMFGEQKLYNIINCNMKEPSRVIMHKIHKELIDFMDSKVLADDLTIISINYDKDNESRKI